jgi:ubiquinone/menaquinone biosynthesis C-methylase UbiE
MPDLPEQCAGESDSAPEWKYLDTVTELNQGWRQQVHALMQVQPGHAVLDVGCGVGADTIALGHLVGPAGRVIGIDKKMKRLAEARQRAAEAGISRWVEHIFCNGLSMPFADGCFDSCHSENVFMHLESPELVLAEMIRVTKPGGLIAIVDYDHATLSIDSADEDLERRIAHFWGQTFRNPNAGRKLNRLYKQQGLVDVQVHLRALFLGNLSSALYLLGIDDILEPAVEASAITPDEAARFRASLASAYEAGEGYTAITTATVLGRKPTQ